MEFDEYTDSRISLSHYIFNQQEFFMNSVKVALLSVIVMASTAHAAQSVVDINLHHFGEIHFSGPLIGYDNESRYEAKCTKSRYIGRDIFLVGETLVVSHDGRYSGTLYRHLILYTPYEGTVIAKDHYEHRELSEEQARSLYYQLERKKKQDDTVLQEKEVVQKNSDEY
jgi:hypothetical protein